MLVAALTWTTVGAGYIAGAQGRYFLPAMPLLLLCAYGLFERRRNTDRALAAVMVLLNLYALVYIFQTVVG
jgi:uncharacterized membrane protein